MQERTLRKWCRDELRVLGLEPPLRVESLCERLGDFRGRPVRLVPHRMSASGPSGLWLATASRDYIVFQSGTSEMHRDHIVLHEVGHILAGHTSQDADVQQWQASMPDLSADMILRALARTCYDAQREREAELIATILMSWTSWCEGWSEPATGVGLSRLAKAFGRGPWQV